MNIQASIRSAIPSRISLPAIAKQLRPQSASTGKAGAVKTAGKTVDPDAAIKAKVQEQFKTQFGTLANDKDAFHAMMKQVFGDSYDAKMAEQYRQQALKGDFSWLPKIEFVDNATLNGANGAYDAGSDTVYLNENLKNDPARAGETYVEEVGHFLDDQLNTSDSAGDEGALFRRLLNGEKLSKEQVRAIRSENDHGTIVVNGEKKAVEFDLWGSIVEAAESVVEVVEDVVETVVDAVTGGDDDDTEIGETTDPEFNDDPDTEDIADAVNDQVGNNPVEGADGIHIDSDGRVTYDPIDLIDPGFDVTVPSTDDSNDRVDMHKKDELEELKRLVEKLKYRIPYNPIEVGPPNPDDLKESDKIRLMHESGKLPMGPRSLIA